MTVKSRTTDTRQKAVTDRLALRGLAAALLAAAANLLVYWLIPALFDLRLEVPAMGPGSPIEPLPASMVVVASVAPAFVATLLLAILTRFTPSPVTIFRTVAAVVLLFSFVPPLSLPVSLAARLVLVSMHVLTAAIIVYTLTGRNR